MKINKKWTESIQDNVLITTEQQDNVVDYEDIKTNAESIISWLGHSKMIFESKESDTLPNYLQYLEAKINAARKTATFWDAYKIVGVVKNIDDFNQKYGVLPNNSGLIIDAPITLDKDHSYTQGDVVYKDFYGNQLCARAQVGGVFKPNSITQVDDTSTYKMKFDYIEQVTDETITIEIPKNTNVEDGIIYNQIISLASNSNSTIELRKDKNGNYITPAWEIRLSGDTNNAYGEKVFGGVTISYNSSKVVFTNNTPFSLVVILK